MTYFESQSDLLAAGTPFVAVTLVDALGSTPQDRGSKMLVTANGLHFGTVGGGKIEARALAEAASLLNSTTERTRFVQWNLQTDIGMTCGGVVKLFFEAHLAHPWRVAVFGAGHIAQALIRTLLNLECHVACFDPREEWLQKLPAHPRLTPKLSAALPQEVSTLHAQSFVILMSMGHSTDAPILAEILKLPTAFPYLGVIGSAAKRAALLRSLSALEVPPDRRNNFLCPVGLPLGTNHPYEIAISIAAQLLQTRDTLAPASSTTKSDKTE